MRKRILYVVTRAVTAGGVMSIVSKKIKYLTGKGYEITLLSMTRCEKPFYSLPEDVQLICCSNKIDFKVDFSDLKKAIKVIRDGQYDVVVSADAQYITWVLPFVTNKPIVLEIHQSYDGLIDFYNRGNFARLNVLCHKLLQRLVFSRYKKLVVLTDEDCAKWSFQNTVVIPNFHNINIIQNNIDDNYEYKIIVCVGRYHFQKGFDLLIEMWKIVSCNHPDWQLHYYGVEPSDQVLEEVRRLDAPNSFILKGYEKDLSKVYSKAYLNIVPSRCESFSLTTIEAMCFGVPTVSFNTTGPKSIIYNDVDGSLIEMFDIHEMACVVDNLISCRSMRNKMSVNCLKKADLYSENFVMKKWEQLFSQLIK